MSKYLFVFCPCSVRGRPVQRVRLWGDCGQHGRQLGTSQRSCFPVPCVLHCTDWSWNPGQNCKWALIITSSVVLSFVLLDNKSLCCSQRWTWLYKAGLFSAGVGLRWRKASGAWIVTTRYTLQYPGHRRVPKQRRRQWFSPGKNQWVKHTKRIHTDLLEKKMF